MRKNNGYIFIILFAIFVGLATISVFVSKLVPVSVNKLVKNNDISYVIASTDSKQSKQVVESDFVESLNDLVFNTNKKDKKTISQEVYLGGQTIGMSFDTEGAVIIGINEFLAKEGLVSPAVENDLRIGDTIIDLNGKKILNSSALFSALQEIENKSFSLTIKRGTELIKKTLSSKFDIISKTYKLGLWVKDASSGIGTVTFFMPNGNFASLGHPVVDSKNGEIIKVTDGNAYNCKILSIEKGEKGKAGELRGVIDSHNKIGKISANNNYGVYGAFDLDSTNKLKQKTKTIEIASRDSVKPGKAKIVCTLEEGIQEEYEIEIIKTFSQNSIQDKSMVIRVTDKRLLELSGGIVQGMSGSPIIQNDKLVGAVTHVFINDPTKGYGIYAEWMLIR